MSFTEQVKSYLLTLTNQPVVSSKKKHGTLFFSKEINQGFYCIFINQNIDKNPQLSIQYPVNYIYEDLWINKKEVYQSRICSKFKKNIKIYARNTQVVPIDNLQVISFLEQNHLLVPIKAKYKYGLSYKGEIVAIATFGKILDKTNQQPITKSGELLRFCCVLNTTVVGGLGKLIKHFINNFKVDDIMTYIDNDFSDGSGFEKIGFKLVNKITPNLFYIDKETMKRFYSENMLDKDCYYYVYNTGSKKYILSCE